MTTKHVLIIDDEADIQEVLQGCFEDVAGWQVLLASSGQEGLVKAAAAQPDAIVLDVLMPGMDGRTFLRQLKANPAIESIPVIFLTSRVDFTDPQDLPTLGAAGAIAQPFDPIQLAHQIATVLCWT